MLLRALSCGVLATTAVAQGPAPLPANYKPILENADVLVQRVHYGPHEFVPMHDHPAVATVYVYLNDSGVVEIKHEGPEGSTVERPPTHTGAFRVSPGNFERHSVKNLSEIPSDFLRIELKGVAVRSLPAEFRGAAPVKPYETGTKVVYDNPRLRVERTICASNADCMITAEKDPSVVVRVLLKNGPLAQPVSWLTPGELQEEKTQKNPAMGTEVLPLEILRIVLPKSEE